MAVMIPAGFCSALVTRDPSLFLPSRGGLPSLGGFASQRRPVALRAVASGGPGKREPRGITKPKPVSPAMQALVGVPEIPRTQALKLIWAYIKQHNLQHKSFHYLGAANASGGFAGYCFQMIKRNDIMDGNFPKDPENKKIIMCDEKLKNIFGGRDRVGFLEISGLLSPHFGK